MAWYAPISGLPSVGPENSFCASRNGFLRQCATHLHWQARSWPAGSGGPDPPELLRVTFLNRVNPETFCGGRG